MRKQQVSVNLAPETAQRVKALGEKMARETEIPVEISFSKLLNALIVRGLDTMEKET